MFHANQSFIVMVIGNCISLNLLAIKYGTFSTTKSGNGDAKRNIKLYSSVHNFPPKKTLSGDTD